MSVVLFCFSRDCDCSGLCTGPFPIHFCATFTAGLCAHLIRLFSVSSQHAMEHVERPGESQEASEGKKCCFYTVFYSVLCSSLKLFDQRKLQFQRG